MFGISWSSCSRNWTAVLLLTENPSRSGFELYPDIALSLSSELAPVLGEYERCATTVINAYLSQRVGAYLRELDRRLSDNGLQGRVMIMLSNGGVAPADQ